MNRWLRCLAALVAATSLAGCAAEFKNSGGWLGEVGDRNLPGASKELQLYRAAAAFAIFSSAGARMASGPDQVLGTLRYMTAVRNDLNGLAGHLWAEDPGNRCGLRLKSGECVDRRVTFESDLPVLEGNLYKLAVVALPVKALEQVFNNLIAQDWLGAITGLLKPGEELLGAAHHGAATSRAERELLAMVVWIQNDEDPAFDPQDTVQGAHATLGKLEKAGGPDPAAYRPVGAWLKRNPRAFGPLYDMVQTSCGRMLGRLPDKSVAMAVAIADPDGKPLPGEDKDSDLKRRRVCSTFKLNPG